VDNSVQVQREEDANSNIGQKLVKTSGSSGSAKSIKS